MTRRWFSTFQYLLGSIRDDFVLARSLLREIAARAGDREEGGMTELTEKETLAMYRSALYAAMRIGRGHLPTDYQCIQWLTKMRQHAEQLQVGPHLPSVGGFPEQWLMEVGYER